jgi:exosortase
MARGTVEQGGYQRHESCNGWACRTRQGSRRVEGLPFAERCFHVWPSMIALALFVAALIQIYWPVIIGLGRQWVTDADAAHALICVPLAIGFANSRREELRRTIPRPRVAGLALAAGALGLLLLGRLGAELFLTRFSLVVFLAGSVVFLSGWRHLRILAFPFVLLLLSVPIPSVLVAQVTLPLQLFASAGAESTLQAMSIPVFRDGNILVLPNATLQVAEACSGIRTLVSLVALSLIIARTTEHRAWARALIVLSAAPVAVLVNALRVTTTAAGTYWYGTAASEGFVHELVGVAMFFVALALVMSCGRGIARLGPEPDRLGMAG